MSANPEIESDKGILFETKIFNWEIKLAKLLDMPEKKDLYSPHFIQGDCEWYLAVDHKDEWIGGYLFLYQFKNKILTEEDPKIPATFQIQMEIASRDLKDETKCFKEFLNDGYGCGRLLSFDPRNAEKDDVLAVRCQIWTKDEPDPMLKLESGFSLLCNQIGGLLDDSILTDLSIQVEGEEFKAHKSILAARSPVFRRMFETEMVEAAGSQLIIEDSSKEVVQQMLKFVYSGDKSLIQKDDVPLTEMLQIADKYELVQLKGVCEALLGNNLTVDNVIEMLILADTHNASTLKKQTLEYIVKNYAKVFKTKAYLGLKSVEIIKEITQEVCSALAKK